MTRYYTGVGSRRTPPNILLLMSQVATHAARDGWVLRSGGATGADQAFERGAGSAKVIFGAADATAAAMEIAARFHPAWGACNAYARRMHGRNVFQVLGLDLSTPSACLICWTPDSATSHAERSRETGGTGTAISVASANGIPVWNLARPDHLETWLRTVELP